ncbi:MAG: hypothetical protein JO100_03685 [Pseudonocardia sp.]|nr:hypothetical protein [Pseudonocardia sp.]
MTRPAQAGPLLVLDQPSALGLRIRIDGPVNGATAATVEREILIAGSTGTSVDMIMTLVNIDHHTQDRSGYQVRSGRQRRGTLSRMTTAMDTGAHGEDRHPCARPRYRKGLMIVVEVTIIPLRTDQALVLALSDAAGNAASAEITRALRKATADVPPPALVVLDVRDVDVLAAHTAWMLVAFAQGSAERGIRCVLLLQPTNTVARTVLDSADPGTSVPRFATLEQALAEHAGAARASGPTHAPPDGSPTQASGEQVVDVTDMETAQRLLSDSSATATGMCASRPAASSAGCDSRR